MDGVLSPCGTSWETKYITFPSLPSVLASVRHKIIEFARAVPFPKQELYDLEIAIGEACSNAVRHGTPGGGEIRVACKRNERTFVVEISDCGEGFDPTALSQPDPNQMKEGGMGIYLMHMLMDAVEFDFDGGTTVRLVKHCRAGKHTRIVGKGIRSAL
ncbi:MAG: ATP-binding protein [Armatimonadota bacterium]